MAIIGTFTQSGTGYTGSVKTLTINAKIRFVPVEERRENGPDYRVLAGSNIELGAAWAKSDLCFADCGRGRRSESDLVALIGPEGGVSPPPLLAPGLVSHRDACGGMPLAGSGAAAGSVGCPPSAYCAG